MALPRLVGGKLDGLLLQPREKLGGAAHRRQRTELGLPHGYYAVVREERVTGCF